MVGYACRELLNHRPVGPTSQARFEKSPCHQPLVKWVKSNGLSSLTSTSEKKLMRSGGRIHRFHRPANSLALLGRQMGVTGEELLLTIGSAAEGCLTAAGADSGRV